MYKSMLFLHWKQVRLALGLSVVAAFALPLMAIEGLGAPPGMDTASLEAYRFVSGFEAWIPFFPLLALMIGLTIALSAWNWDHAQGHVYALSLPMSRWEYTLQKLLAGLTLCVPPAIGMWIGAHVAAGSIDLPAGLHAYPNELSVRFLFAILLSYGVLFALAAGTIRTTAWVFGIAFSFIFFGLMANDLLADYSMFLARVNVVESVMEWMLEAPGPFEVFTGSWSLIDV